LAKLARKTPPPLESPPAIPRQDGIALGHAQLVLRRFEFAQWTKGRSCARRRVLCVCAKDKPPNRYCGETTKYAAGGCARGSQRSAGEPRSHAARHNQVTGDYPSVNPERVIDIPQRPLTKLELAALLSAYWRLGDARISAGELLSLYARRKGGKASSFFQKHAGAFIPIPEIRQLN